MNAIEFYSYRVPYLWNFLLERGVNCSLTKKTDEVNGVNVVIPSLNEVKTWQKHLGNLPDINTYDILILLMT